MVLMGFDGLVDYVDGHIGDDDGHDGVVGDFGDDQVDHVGDGARDVGDVDVGDDDLGMIMMLAVMRFAIVFG